MLKFPYGNSDFHHLVTGHYFYVDRTAQIRLIEARATNFCSCAPVVLAKVCHCPD